MNIGFNCVRELEGEDLFESDAHMSRFSELLSCYSDYPFFNAGLCKAMYLGSWDEEHFIMLLSILNDMTLERSQDTEVMEDNGEILEEESEGRDREMMRLSLSFLTGETYVMPEDTDSETRHIIERCLRASEVIDRAIEK